MILYTVVAKRRQLTLWRARALAALAQLEQRGAMAFRALLNKTGTHAARQRWQILTARALFYVQRCDAALAGLALPARGKS